MEALGKAKLFVIILSHQSVASDHVKNELTNAVNLRKAILPVRLVECPVRLPANFQYHLERHQQFDMDKHSYAEIISAAGQLLGNQAKDPARARGNSQQTRGPEPVVKEGAADTGKLRRILEICLQDGKITQLEMELLLAEAADCFPEMDREGRDKAIRELALEIRPDFQMEC
jgi:hypothetical protein